jgi:hypothetical protein
LDNSTRPEHPGSAQFGKGFMTQGTRRKMTMGGLAVKDKSKEETEIQVKKKKAKKPLPFCTTAPSAEHARADSDDEPCDDSRSGEES